MPTRRSRSQSHPADQQIRPAIPDPGPDRAVSKALNPVEAAEVLQQSLRQVIQPSLIEHLPLAAIHLNPRNARQHSGKQIEQLAASLKAFGFITPAIIDEADQLLAGHGRMAAARQLGLATVPCVRVQHLTPEAKRAFALADNRLAELSSWDEDLLRAELEELASLEADLSFSIEITGFDTVDLDRLLGPEPTSKSHDAHADVSTDPDDDLPPLAPDAVSRPGDLWEMGSHLTLCGDALDPDSYDRLLRGDQVTQVFTDPPYNVPVARHVTSAAGFREFAMASGEMSAAEFTAFLTTFLQRTARHLVDGAILHVCMDWRHQSELLAAARQVGLSLKNLCVWVKPAAGMGTFYRSQHELVYVFKSGDAPHINTFGLGSRGRSRSNVWRYPSVIGARSGVNSPDGGHPTVKPVTLVIDALRDCSHRNAIVLDPFGGSGTTLIAAERIRRRARLIELDPLYVDLIVARWQQLTGGSAILSGDGRPFEAVKAERLTRTDDLEPQAALAAPTGGQA